VEPTNRDVTYYDAGAELSYAQILFARLGYAAIDGVRPKALTLGFGLGVPVGDYRFRFDWALVPLDIVNVSHRDLDRTQKFAFMVAWIPGS
jgi:hypothetical protein